MIIIICKDIKLVKKLDGLGNQTQTLSPVAVTNLIKKSIWKPSPISNIGPTQRNFCLAQPLTHRR